MHKTSKPTKLVYTDVMGPIKPAAKGGYPYDSTFTDEYATTKDIFLLKSKAEAANLLHIYNISATAPLGLCIQRLGTDKGGEHTSKAFRRFFIDSGITVGYTVTATPQHNGVSERDGRTSATILTCVLKDGSSPETNGEISSRQFTSPTGGPAQRWEEQHRSSRCTARKQTRLMY